jgi:FkbM family methyltransferase
MRFVAETKDSAIIYDAGANVGFYTLLASACVGLARRVFAFEPLPDNIATLKLHVQLNRCNNVEIRPLAIGHKSGTLKFEPGESCCTGRLSDCGNLEVPAVSLGDFVFKFGNPRPNLIKIDVVGGEFDVLNGADRLLREHPPIIFLATHFSELHNQCCVLLLRFGYRLDTIDGKQVTHTDELICFPPGH